MIVVIYAPEPGDLLSGPITECFEAPPADVAALALPWVEVDERRPDWDATHCVAAGVVVPRDPAAVAADVAKVGMARVRVRRDGLLRDVVDPVVSNPLRWNELSAEEQAAVAAWRVELLGWPAAETNLAAPTVPSPPDCLGVTL